MPEKDSEDSFYYLNAYQDDITPGQKMTILHNISFNDWRAGPHIAPGHADERGSHTAQGGQHYAGKRAVRPAKKTCGGVG